MTEKNQGFENNVKNKAFNAFLGGTKTKFAQKKQKPINTQKVTK